jgi:MtrB/PioB family decaheme-associated outer membrane protein
MLKKKMNLYPLLLTAALAPAAAQAEVDTSQWACESCPFDQGYRATVDAGVSNVSDDAARFGNYTGYDEQGTYANLDAQGRYNEDGYRLDYTLEDAGLDSRAFDLTVGSEGLFEVRFGYRELPFRRFDTSSTIFVQSSGDTLTLPSGWVPAGTTDGMTQLASASQARSIGTDRNILDLGGTWTPQNSFRLFADYRRQTRDGIDITSAGGYTQASFLPRWIDYETDQIDAGFQYRSDAMSVRVAWYGSFFTNNNASLTWDTPFLATSNMATLRMAREPDNEYQQLSVSGKYRLTTWDTVIAAAAATGQGKQNELLLPYTINPDPGPGSGNGVPELPRSSLDGKVDTVNYSLSVTSRPIDGLRLKFGYRYDERDNKTLVSDWSRVILDAFGSGEIEQNVPHSYDRALTTISGEYAILDTLRLSAGYEYRETNRDFQEVAEQTTHLGWGQVRWQLASWLDLRAKAGQSTRSNDRYDDSVGASLGQNPLMRKYNLAYRYREFGELVATVTPLDSPLSFSATVAFADDDYRESLVGINGSEEFRATADVSWAISNSASVYFMYGRNGIDGHQTGSEQFEFWDWSAFHEDTFDHTGVGFNWRPADSKLSFHANYNRGSGTTEIALDSLSGGPSRLPDLESTLDSARVEASYAFSDRLDFTFDLRYERFDMKDWALVSETTLPTVLTMGAEPYDYDVYAVGLGVRYRFGTGEISLAE